jgi:hypothetical protein
MTSLRSWFCLCLLAAMACAGDGAREPIAGGFVVAAIAPGEEPRGEAILNVHWFPQDGGASLAALYIDGAPAVLAEGTAIRVGLAEEAPPVLLPLGAHTVELVVGDDVVASETIDAAELMVYSLVAFGERSAPRKLFFAESIPDVYLAASPDGRAPVTIYNLMPGAPPIFGSMLVMGSPRSQRVFEGLAYGEAWHGTYGVENAFLIDDAPQPSTFTGGTVFRGFGPARHYVTFRHEHSGSLGATVDGWFLQ